MSEDTKKPLNTNLQANVQETQNNFIKSDYIIKSHDLVQQGYKVYLLAQGTNSPYKASKGHLDATNDVRELTNMFLKYGANSNVGIILKDTKLLTLDIDRHTPDKNGLKTLKQLGITPNFDDEVIEKSPRNGIHVFYRVPDDLDVTKLKRNIGAGLELVTDKITIAPSVKGGVAYKHFGKSFNEASMMPKWLIELASNVATSGNTQTGRVPKYSVKERWQMVLNGFTEGERNLQCTSISGYLLRLGIPTKVAYEIVDLVNSRSSSPLADKEINTIFRSVYEREKRRLLGGQ
ncbi:DNA primase [Leuconostoc mesenteroides subsp. cremoris]|uniref:bifunctional DNA primase/polymerase n=1 Tax=Leuconostoc mesenteroides TaxID=1245 RepID=UPI000A010BDE|nr:bifunctional DNA primase/polymerase [Leuconostoc mesenteroides]ORI39282.1 DNA primase [Leuconostoc mesenteroides subsp. cremoris]ORI39919.1 DNA primase [Leuconostoc mesenteroides subsp. cremoris]